MPGIVQFLSKNDLLEARRNWRLQVTKVHTKAHSLPWNYVLFAEHGRFVCAAKVLSVTKYPNEDECRWMLEFSSFKENPSLKFSAEGVGGRTEWFEADKDAEVLALFEHSEKNRTKEDPKLNISINEAVKALSLRYEIDETNIKITLHN